MSVYKKMLRLFFVALWACILHTTATAQLSNSTALYQSIMQQDSLLFNVGFNSCDIKQFENLLTADFEFYHDKAGIQNRQAFLDGLKNGLCKTPDTYQSRRQLVDSFTAIFPLYKNGELYGVVQNGVHQFYERMQGKPEQYASTARFTHLWLMVNNRWQLARSISYDHVAPGN
ncbi:MAG: hypothetical protein RL172_1718 [Bacteroidota bacterium]|jgi:hypothetical protein